MKSKFLGLYDENLGLYTSLMSFLWFFLVFLIIFLIKKMITLLTFY